jgi:hypothetical protein
VGRHSLVVDLFAKTFFASNGGPYAEDGYQVALAIAAMFPDKQFWCDYREVLGVRTGETLIVDFEGSPGATSFCVPIGPIPSGQKREFEAPFQAYDYSGDCFVCIEKQIAIALRSF